MGIFDKLFGGRNGGRICSSCGKRMRQVYGSFPTEYLPDTVGAICGNCKSLLCHECRWMQGMSTCPKCGYNVLVTVTDEDLDRLERTGSLIG